MPGVPDPLYVLARSVLLDALEALAEHRAAVILVGAQAVYLHTGDGDLTVAPYTVDGDVALNPQLLGPHPLLDDMLRRAGFTPSDSPSEIGRWRGRENVMVDLLVPEALAGPGRRGARLDPHGNSVARRAVGLEAALVDHAEMTLSALDPSDSRQLRVNVAGPSALLVAKLHKLAERLDTPRLQRPKDALDTYRLLQATATDTMAAGLRTLIGTAISAEVTREALRYLAELFGTETSAGSTMAGEFAGSNNDPETVAMSCAVLAQDLLAMIQADGT
jgi:nucleotidyltransferase-like protein